MTKGFTKKISSIISIVLIMIITMLPTLAAEKSCHHAINQDEDAKETTYTCSICGKNVYKCKTCGNVFDLTVKCCVTCGTKRDAVTTKEKVDNFLNSFNPEKEFWLIAIIIFSMAALSSFIYVIVKYIRFKNENDILLYLYFAFPAIFIAALIPCIIAFIGPDTFI